MYFWTLFSLSILLIFIISKFFNRINRNYIVCLFVIYIIIIACFRNNIGIDYNSYMMLFYNAIAFDLEGIEPSFIWLSYWIQYFGFNYRMLFLLYALPTLIFVFLACRYYSRDVMFSLMIYSLFPFFFWTSLTGIRQGLAMSIIFWGSKFLIENKYIKFLLIVFVSFMIHFSAIIALGMCFLYKINFSRKTHLFLLIFSLIIGMTDIPFLILDFCLNLFDLRYVQYLLTYSTVFSGVGFSIQLLFACFILFMYKNHDSVKNNLIINFYSFSIILGNIMIFSSPLARLKDYFYIFMIIAFPYALKQLKYEFLIKMLIGFFGVVYFLYAVSQTPHNLSASNNNIEYEFKIDFIE